MSIYDKNVVQVIMDPALFLQRQAPAGNWVDDLGAHDLEVLVSHRDYYLNLNPDRVYRIIRRATLVLDI